MDFLQDDRRKEFFLLARAALRDVHGREDAALEEAAIEDDLGVTRSLELLEDHFVHARAGVDQRGGDDGQRAPVLGVARRAEEASRFLHGTRVDAAGKDLSRSSLLVVVRA